MSLAQMMNYQISNIQKINNPRGDASEIEFDAVKLFEMMFSSILIYFIFLNSQ